MRCSKCGCEKSPDAFSCRGRGSRRRQPYCRECQKIYKAEHYRRHRATYIRRAAERKAELRRRVDEMKMKPCVDCGQTYPPSAMEFDHLDKKSFDVSRGVWNGKSWDVILAEILKCDLVCAICHRLRSEARRKIY